MAPEAPRRLSFQISPAETASSLVRQQQADVSAAELRRRNCRAPQLRSLCLRVKVEAQLPVRSQKTAEEAGSGATAALASVPQLSFRCEPQVPYSKR